MKVLIFALAVSCVLSLNASSQGVQILNAIGEKTFIDNERLKVTVSPGKSSIEIKDVGVTAEYYADSMNALWNKMLLPKILAGEELDDTEISLIWDILGSQTMFLDTIILSFANSYGLSATNFNKLLDSYEPIHDCTRDDELKLINAYLFCKLSSRRLITRHCENFTPIGGDSTLKFFRWCFDKQNKYCREARLRRDTVDWLLRANPVTEFIAESRKNVRLTQEESEAVKLIATPNEISRAWLDVESMILPRLKIFMRMKMRLEEYANSENLCSVDSGSKIKDILIKIKSSRVSMDLLCALLYDYPFMVLTFRASGEYRKSKGTFSDNEYGIEVAMRKYATSINGAHFLTHVTSNIAHDLYVQLLKEVKSDLDFIPLFSTNYSELIKVTRLAEMGNKSRKEDAETGLYVNSSIK